MTQPLLDMQHVDISYGGKPVVPGSVSSDGTRRDPWIVGESGSGKSTVLKGGNGAAGKTPEPVTRGDIYYKGTECHRQQRT